MEGTEVADKARGILYRVCYHSIGENPHCNGDVWLISIHSIRRKRERTRVSKMDGWTMSQGSIRSFRKSVLSDALCHTTRAGTDFLKGLVIAQHAKICGNTCPCTYQLVVFSSAHRVANLPLESTALN